MLDKAFAYGLQFDFPATDTAIGPCLRDYGEFARPEIDLIADLSDGGLVDVGANIGAICLPISRKLPNQNIVAIESHPEIYSILERNILQNNISNVKAISAVAGEENQTVEIPIANLSEPNNVGASTLYASGLPTQNAKMIRIDDFAPPDADFVKIDVEGFEPRVLFGAERLLSTRRPSWLVEVSKSRPDAFNLVVSTFSAHKYNMYWFFSPFLTRKRPRRLEERVKLRGDVSILATDRAISWDICRFGGTWPTDVADFPYLGEYGLFSAREGRQ